ncbi:hypothetical protein [Aeromicrobium fastidiosum]|uniref:hypothetical protein n=1 Tax=Aeromicrobium fastidiosum TaxID=52699 RepID=UPI00165F2ADB|nr:hypothetical protein [Aeromicrobium fastidiosum]MBP2392049.1 hypothetical protein [Aeromicrobium fastidiosum]
MAFDIKTVGRNDQIALVAGAATVLLTLFPWYATFSAKAKNNDGSAFGSIGGSESINAWHEWALFGVLLLVAALVIVVLRVVVGNVLPAGVPWNLVTAGAAGLGTLILVIYPFTFGPDVPAIVSDSVDIGKGPGWSGWLLIVAALVFTAFSFLAFKESGEKIPEINRAGGATPPSYGSATPPATGTATPPVPPTAPPAAPPAPPAAPPAPPTAPPAPPAGGPTPPPAPPAS